MSAIDRTPAALPDLRTLTQARVLLGRHGAGLSTRAAQAFLLDHARARQAVWTEVDWPALKAELAGLPYGFLDVESQAADRSLYVRRPDLGRIPSPEAQSRLRSVAPGFDVVLIVGDGLSASAIGINAAPLLTTLCRDIKARGLTLAPIVCARNARVALGDPVGEILNAQIAVMLIGERPGLSAADSLGIYVTYGPQPGTPDSRRNCISNVRDGGLSIEAAASAIMALVADMLRQKTSGVALARTPSKGGTLIGQRPADTPRD